jgi:hypothetical protein
VTTKTHGNGYDDTCHLPHYDDSGTVDVDILPLADFLDVSDNRLSDRLTFNKPRDYSSCSWDFSRNQISGSFRPISFDLLLG